MILFISVGLDVQSEYMFQGMEPLFSRGESKAYPIEELTAKKMIKKQTTITDTFKERKRKIYDLDISQSKEKKKRDNVVIEKFRHFIEPFGKLSMELRDVQKPAEISNKLLLEMTPSNKQVRKINHDNIVALACEDDNDCGTIAREYEYSEIISEDLDNQQDFIDDGHFDNILSEIENEISKSRRSNEPSSSQKHTTPIETTPLINNPNPFSKPNYKLIKPKRQPKSTRCNYSFIERLQRKEKLSDEDGSISSKDGGFSDTIKSQVEKFMKASTNTTNIADAEMTILLSTPLCSELSDKEVTTVESRTENVVLHDNNKAIDKDTTIISKPLKNCTIVSKDLVSLNKYNVDMPTENPNVISGICKSNNDISQMALKETKNKKLNEFILDNKPNKANLLNVVNQTNDIQNVAENITLEMFVDFVKNTREPTYFSEELLESPCDLKKNDNRQHKIVPENCLKNNNVEITIPEHERKGNYEQNGVEIIKDNDEYVAGRNSHEKYISKYDPPIPSDNKNKQLECANKSHKLSNQLTLPHLNTMSTKTSQGNTANLVDKLNQASIVKCNRSEKQHILYFNKHVGEIKPFNETKQSTQPKPNNIPKQVNTILSSISEKSLQNTKDENLEIFEPDDTMRSAISKEVSPSVLSFNPKKEKYVNTYSFSSMKVDVQTKKHADVEVQIIRKLKVDLDITEILTHKEKDVQMNKGNTAQTSNCVDCSLSRAFEVPNYLRKCETSDQYEDGLRAQPAYELDPLAMCAQENSVKKIAPQVIQGVNEKELAIVQGQNLEKSQTSEDPKGRLQNIFKKYSKILK